MLTAAQAAAIASIRENARRLALSTTVSAPALARARVHVHFHPERLTRAGDSVIEGLRRDGVYRTQFETGISTGSPTAFAGGDRDAWERTFFAGAYHTPEVSPADRPRYGALDLAGHPDGAAPRFGACYFVLKPEVNARCTFTWGGSHEPGARDRSGTLDAPAPFLSALMLEVARTGAAFGGPLDVPALTRLLTEGPAPARDRAPGRALDSFVEVQIHGPIRLAHDVERVVADPSHRGTPEGEHLQALARELACPLGWHAGFALASARFPEVFRGYPSRDLAEHIAPGGTIDAAVLGRAENAFVRAPDEWCRWGTRSDVLTRFRRLWHVLVLHGEPALISDI